LGAACTCLCYNPCVNRKEPIKLIPLDEFKKLVAAIAQVPKENVEKAKRMKSKRKKGS